MGIRRSRHFQICDECALYRPIRTATDPAAPSERDIQPTLTLPWLPASETQRESGWGYKRIHGALINLDVKIACGTIQRILKGAPDRTRAGFVIDLATRRVDIAGITTNPNEA
jgi:hypothetical protein